MSTSHAHRRPALAAARRFDCGLRRRLGFEIMEGRCLLSAATLEFTAFSPAGAQETAQVSLVAPVGGQLAHSTALVEGGFISVGGIQTDSIPPVLTNAAGAGRGVTLDLLGADSLMVHRANSTPALYTDFNTIGDGIGLRPVVITPSGGSIAVKPSGDPLTSLDDSQGRGAHEGGIVPIERILRGDEPFDSGKNAKSLLVGDTPEASTVPDDSPGVGLRSLALPAESDSAADAPPSSAASTQLAVSLSQRSADLLRPTQNDVITGELARAMVFEMAGGEPAWVCPAVTIEKVKAASPTDRQEGPTADAPPPSTAAAQQTAIRSTTGRIRLSGNQVEFTLPADDWSELNIAAQSRIESTAADGETGAPGSGLSAFNAAEAGFAEVFELIGRNDQTLVRGSFEDDPRSGPWVAGSVIALLMLERVMARYKSRTDKQVLTVVAGPPRI